MEMSGLKKFFNFKNFKEKYLFKIAINKIKKAGEKSPAWNRELLVYIIQQQFQLQPELQLLQQQEQCQLHSRMLLR